MICLDSRCLFTSSFLRKLAPQMLHNQRPDDWSLCMLAYAKSSSSSKESWTLSPVKRGCMKKIEHWQAKSCVYLKVCCLTLLWMYMEWMSCFKRFPTSWAINLRQYDMLRLQVSLYVEFMEEVGPANAAQPASRWLVLVHVSICKIFELFKGKLNLISCKRV